MHDDFTLISTIAAALGMGLVLGVIALRLKLPPLVGYLAAGVVIGPATPGFVGDLKLSAQLAEIGVMLLMFGVGLHFSFNDLLKVRKIALPGAVLQIAVATLLGMGLAWSWGWGIGAGLVFGLSLSVASTVVLLRALEDRKALDTIDGQIAVGWLVVEDLVTVLVLVLLPAVSGLLGGQAQGHSSAPLWKTIAITLGQVGAFILFMLVAGRRLFPWILWRVARSGSRELFTLCVIAAALGIAYGAAKVFGVSFALGAFFAGMVLQGSALSRRAAEESLPLRDAFSVLFFVSVGMLFDPKVLLESPWHVLAVVAVIMVGKSVAAFALVILLRYPVSTAMLVSASLAQIGEFSFILAGLGMSLGLLPAQGHDFILAGAIISIALNPLAFAAVKPLSRMLGKGTQFERGQAYPADPLAGLPMETPLDHIDGHVVLVGFGRVGQAIARDLEAAGLHYVVVEQNRERVEQLRNRRIDAVAGDATEAEVLIQAHIARAAALVVATPDTFGVRKMADIARTLKPGMPVIARSHSHDEADLLRRDGIAQVLVGEEVLARFMAQSVVEAISKASGAAHGAH